MTNIVRLHSEATASSPIRGPSPQIFGDLSKIYQDQLMGKCILIYDDFQRTQIHANAQASGGDYTYQDTGVVIAGLNTVSDIAQELGVLEISGNDADNDEGHIQFGYGNMFRVENTAGNTGKVMYEIRLNQSAVADNGIAFFAGLGQGPVAADYLIDDTGELHASRGFLGFQRLADDGDKVDIVYKASGQTKQTVLANAATLVANTYIKLGFLFDNSHGDDNFKVRFYVDGVEANTGVTTTNIDAATFPEAEPMQPVLLTKAGSASLSVTTHVDWIAAAQYCDGEE